MQSLAGIPSFASSFSKHRSHCYSQKCAVDISLSNTTAAPNWASLPSPPMSSSPPQEDPREQPQVAGRRRKRSTTPPVPPPAAAPSSTPTAQAPSGRRGPQHRDPPELATTALTAPPFPSSYPSAHSFGYGPGTPTIISATPATREPPLGAGDISPRATRKTKAHVASACVNCKKKHLRCDNARPCRRCVQSGKETSCVDVEHKKRGRPPLKPEEAQARRPFESPLNTVPGHLATFNRLHAPPSSSYPGQPAARSLRPGQSGPGSDPGRAVFPRPAPPYQTIYAQPTVSPSPATALGTMSRPVHGGLAGHAQAPPAYATSQSGGMHVLGPEDFSQYAGHYSYISSPPIAPYSLFPRTTAQIPASLPPTSPSGYGHMQAMPADLRLPPIQPAPPGGGVDPAMAQQQRQAHQQSRVEQQSGTGTTRQPDPKRPKISDILRHD